LGTSLSPDVDWVGIQPKTTLLDEYRTSRGELRIEILRQLKARTEPVTVNVLHDRLIKALRLTFKDKFEQNQHRAVVVDALHDLRNGPPSLVESTEDCVFGVFRQPEQRWRLKQMRPRTPEPT
jgi:hypothetical protein